MAAIFTILRNLINRTSETESLYPVDAPACLSHSNNQGNANSAAQLEESDMSYEDALLDAQLRVHLHSQYGPLEPSEDVFYRVLDAIAEGERRKAPAPSSKSHLEPFLSQFRASINKALTGPSMARVAPTLVVLLLTVASLSSRTSQLFTNEQGGSFSEASATPAVQSGQVGSRLSHPQNLWLKDTDPLDSVSAYSGQLEYDPIEGRRSPRFLPDKSHATDGQDNQHTDHQTFKSVPQ